MWCYVLFDRIASRKLNIHNQEQDNTFDPISNVLQLELNEGRGRTDCGNYGMYDTMNYAM